MARLIGLVLGWAALAPWAAVAQSAPGQSAPGQSAPGQSAPGQSASMQSASMQSASMQSASMQSASMQSASMQSGRAPTDEPVVLTVDVGSAQLNTRRLSETLARELGRPVVSITDARARTSTSRLTIGFARPNRWVLRYESAGRVQWVTEHHAGGAGLRAVIVRASRALIGSNGAAPRERAAERAEPAVSAAGRDWSLGLMVFETEIVDPFVAVPIVRPRFRWGAVVDPFRETLRDGLTVVTEVLDPWSTDSTPVARE